MTFYYLSMMKTDFHPGIPGSIPYQSFLLRFWQNLDAEERTWNLSLEDPVTRKIRVFQNIESLIDYLTQISTKTQVHSEFKKKE